MAPRTVPTTAQQMPTKAIMTMNQRIETVCVTITPQHDLPLSSPAYIDPRDLYEGEKIEMFFFFLTNEKGHKHTYTQKGG